MSPWRDYTGTRQFWGVHEVVEISCDLDCSCLQVPTHFQQIYPPCACAGTLEAAARAVETGRDVRSRLDEPDRAPSTDPGSGQGALWVWGLGIASEVEVSGLVQESRAKSSEAAMPLGNL